MIIERCRLTVVRVDCSGFFCCVGRCCFPRSVPRTTTSRTWIWTRAGGGGPGEPGCMRAKVATGARPRRQPQAGMEK